MKIAETHITKAGVFNVFSLGAISFTWAHFLGLVSLWFLPLTVLLYLLGYTSEVTKK